MSLASSRPTARKLIRKLGSAAGVCVVLLGLSSSPALAVNLAPETVSAALAACPGQTFSQPFTALGDSSYYTLVPGSEFNSPPEGWELLGGAHVLSTTRPDGSTGAALDLPSGSVAVSPPVCVTLQYPTARIWTHTLEGRAGVTVSVAYAETKSESKPREVTTLQSTQTGGWELSEPFNVQPQLGGKSEETRQVRFIFAAGGSSTNTQLYGLYVDPWMR
jgi:hypothetical protein